MCVNTLPQWAICVGRRSVVFKSPVINGGRKCCASKITGPGKAHAVQQAEELVAVVVGIHCGEIVCSRIEIEVGSGGFGGRRDRWCFNVGKLHVLAGER